MPPAPCITGTALRFLTGFVQGAHLFEETSVVGQYFRRAYGGSRWDARNVVPPHIDGNRQGGLRDG